MANTIDNFLVGLGFKYDDKGAKKFSSSLGTIKSKALQLGAVLGTSFAAKSLIFDRSEVADNMGKFADQIGVTASNVNALSSAFKLMGSDASGAMGALQAISKMQSASQQDKASRKQEVAAQGLPSSIVTDILKSKNAYSGYIKLVEDGNKLTAVQRIRLLGVLGLNEKIALQMKQNPKALKESLALFNKIDPDFGKLAKESAAFNDELDKAKISTQGIGDSISSDILPPLKKVASMYNKLVQNHPKVAKDVVESGAGLLAITATGAGAGILHHLYKQKGLTRAAVKGTILPTKILSKAAKPVAKTAGSLLSKAAKPVAKTAGSLLSKAAKPVAKGVADSTEIASKGISAASKVSGFSILDFLGIAGLLLSPNGKMQGGDLSPQEIAINKKFNSYDDTDRSPKTINVNLSLDGETITKKVIDINNKNHTQALHNIQSSIKG